MEFKYEVDSHVEFSVEEIMMLDSFKDDQVKISQFLEERRIIIGYLKKYGIPYSYKIPEVRIVSLVPMIEFGCYIPCWMCYESNLNSCSYEFCETCEKVMSTKKYIFPKTLLSYSDFMILREPSKNFIHFRGIVDIDDNLIDWIERYQMSDYDFQRYCSLINSYQENYPIDEEDVSFSHYKLLSSKPLKDEIIVEQENDDKTMTQGDEPEENTHDLLIESNDDLFGEDVGHSDIEMDDIEYE